MHFITRLASDPRLSPFPLPVDGSLNWQRVSIPGFAEATVWRTSVSVREIPEQHILVPSYACIANRYQYQWQAITEPPSQTSVLTPIVPADTVPWSGFAAEHDDTQALQPKIDCWHSVKSIGQLDLQLTLYLPDSDAPPDRDLLTLSIRPVDQKAGELPHSTAAIASPRPAPISQMQADKTIARRICSPSATVMAVMGSKALEHWHEAVEHCYDPNTKAYGKWPLATYWASQHGVLGSVEALWRWEDALAVLQAGQPIVCSIRFAKDQLPGAPQAQSGGHLLVLYGLEFDQEDGFALVMDPAGATLDEVPRRYPLAAFSDAWLNHRGAAYLFSTNQTKQSGSELVSFRATNHGH